MLEGEEFIFNYNEIDKVQKKIISLKDIENYNFEKKKLSNILRNLIEDTFKFWNSYAKIIFYTKSINFVFINIID